MATAKTEAEKLGDVMQDVGDMQIDILKKETIKSAIDVKKKTKTIKINTNLQKSTKIYRKA